MKNAFILGLLFSLFVNEHTANAQGYVGVSVEDSYLNQENSTTSMNINRDSVLVRDGDIDIQYSEEIDGQWYYKCFAKGENDDFTYFLDNFNAKGWDEIKSLNQAPKYYKEGTERSIYFSKIYISRYWDFRQMFLEIPMSQTVYDLYVNSVKVGSNLDTRNIAKFDITDYVLEGDNSLLIICSADGNKSGLEDSTVGRAILNGDVVLQSTPKVRIEDYELATYFTNNYKKGNLQLNVNVVTHLLNLKETNVLYYLYDRDGKEIMRDNRWTKLQLKNRDVVTFHTMITDVNLYSASNPYLYKAVLMMVQNNRVTQKIDFDVAFMEKKIEQNRILINSEVTMFNGVVFSDDNKIQSDRDYEENILKRLARIDQKGYNSVMLNYPQRPSFYKICDTMGLAVIDVANVDICSSGSSRAVSGSLANAPELTGVIMDRVVRQYFKNRNNVSVLAMRGAKSESNGYNLYETYLKLKEIDDSILFASNATDLEWNNDFVIYYPDKNTEVKIDDSRVSFVVVDSAELYDSWKKIYDKGLITGLFVNEEVVTKS